MVVRSVGPVLIAILMRGERREEPVTDWLLHGPSDPDVVEAAVVAQRDRAGVIDTVVTDAVVGVVALGG